VETRHRTPLALEAQEHRFQGLIQVAVPSSTAAVAAEHPQPTDQALPVQAVAQPESAPAHPATPQRTQVAVLAVRPAPHPVMAARVASSWLLDRWNMAHFAKITTGDDGVMYLASPDDIHVVNNAVITDDAGNESEQIGQQFLADLWGGRPQDYIQVSYNAAVNGFRGKYPAEGDIWTGTEFIPPSTPEPTP
jgi:hypothetical protein